MNTTIDFLAKISAADEKRIETYLEVYGRTAEVGEDSRVININVVEENYKKFKDNLPFATVYAAVKANSAKGILETLDKLGSNFEVATIEELNLCLERGVTANKIIFTHPAKDAVEIEGAYKAGIKRFVSDSIEDLELLSKHAPGSKVMIRMKTNNAAKEGDELTGFDSRFGVTEERAKELIWEAKKMGLTPYGVCFHIGTQEENPNAWDKPIEAASRIFKEMKKKGIALEVLDMGGGFPSRFREDIPELEEYGPAIKASLDKHFGSKNLPKELIIEPGRGISATAGVTIGRVIQVKAHEHDETKSIVTLSTGRFSSGLFGVGNGFIFYSRDNSGEFKRLSDDIAKPADVYGKACASFDKPVEGEFYIPAALKSGDIVVISGTGAYSGEMVTNWCSKKPPSDYLVKDGIHGDSSLGIGEVLRGK